MDLKAYFDAAQKADEEVQRVMNEMNTAFTAGTDDGKAKAMELRPALDEARTKAVDANKLYTSMRDADSTSAAAKLFVPANAAAAAQATGQAEKTLDRPAFEALDATARMKFVRDGGKVVEPAE